MMTVQQIPDNKVQQLLTRVTEIYEKDFDDTLLKDFGIADSGLLAKHRLGFCKGTLTEILPKGGEIVKELSSIGVLNKNGTEYFKNFVVVPVYDVEGALVTLSGFDGNKKIKFLTTRLVSLWNISVIKNNPDIILVSSILDGLSVMTAGYSNVLALNGTDLQADSLELFKGYGVQKITLLADGTDAGNKITERCRKKLTGFSVEIKSFPSGHSANSYLKKYGTEKLAELISSKTKQPAKDKSKDKVQPKQSVEVAAQGINVTYGSRKYQILGLQKGERSLRATVRVEFKGKLHIDTLDFYSARSRRQLAQDLCRIFEEIPATIESDITRLVVVCEQSTEIDSQVIGVTSPAITDKEKLEAEKFGRSPNLIKQIVKDFETCGLIGEEANKLLGYIAMTSRKRENPLAIQILASSGAGKSALQDAVCQFCPPEDLVKLTSLSGKALFYKEQMSLKNKVLALEEVEGAEDAAYAIRTLISSGVLTSESTIKDLSTGRLTTMENRVEGPTAVFFTTTRPDVDPETKNRFFITGVDESREQTRKILAFQRLKHLRDEHSSDVERQAIINRHWNFQRLLRCLSVRNPFAEKLSYGDDRLQGRRDQPKYLNLIKSIAFLRQMQKEIKTENVNGQQIEYIEVDLTDIEIANKLAHEILGRTLDELSRPGHDLLLLIEAMVEAQIQAARKKNKDYKASRADISFSRRDIREHTGWSNYRVHTHIKELQGLEFIAVRSGRNGALYRYQLIYDGQGKQGEQFLMGLTPVTMLQQ